MKSLYEKLYKIQQLALSVSKDGKNPHFKSAYPTLDNTISVIIPKINEIGLLVTHFADLDTFVTRVVDIKSGESLDSKYTLLGTTPQQRGSEQTYFRRYSMIALFNLPSEDDDGNGAGNGNSTQDTPPAYKKTAKDDLIAQMGICTDMEELKTLYQILLTHSISEKQTKFFEGVKDKEKKRIEGLNIHTA